MDTDTYQVVLIYYYNMYEQMDFGIIYQIAKDRRPSSMFNETNILKTKSPHA